jgi:anti-anti-sigma regulatory factor
LTLVLTLLVGMDWGIIASVAIALTILVLRSFKPRLTEIGWLPGTDVFVDRARYPQAVLIPGVILYRVDGDIHYGNVDAVTSLLQKTLNFAISTGALPVSPLTLDEIEFVRNDDNVVIDISEVQPPSPAAHAAAPRRSPSPSESFGDPHDDAEEVVVEFGSPSLEPLQSPSRDPPPDGPRSVRSNRGGRDTPGNLSIRAPSDRVLPPPRWYSSSAMSPIPIDVRAAHQPDDTESDSSAGGALTRRSDNTVAKEVASRLDKERRAMLSAQPLRAVIIDFSRVSGVDLTACQELHDEVSQFAEYNIMLLFAAMPGHVRDQVERFGVLDAMDPILNPDDVPRRRKRRFLTVCSAVEAIAPRSTWPVADPDTLAITTESLPLAVKLFRLRSADTHSVLHEENDDDGASQLSERTPSPMSHSSEEAQELQARSIEILRKDDDH